MVEPTDTWERHDAADLRRLYLALGGGVRLQGHVRPVDVIVGEVLSENSPKMLLVENDHVVETLATDRADQSLGVGILPRGDAEGDSTRCSPSNRKSSGTCCSGSGDARRPWFCRIHTG